MPIERKSEIVEAEFTPVIEETTAPEQPSFSLDDVGEMVMVGRWKDGREFVQTVNFDDVLKAKAYSDYALTHYQMIIEAAIFERQTKRAGGK
jgi:hypothetical protein